jgi:hypothetical protein
MIALRLRARVNSVPPKESPPAFQKSREDASPKASTRRNLEPDPIYPYLPFLFGFIFGNDRAKFFLPGHARVSA